MNSIETVAKNIRLEVMQYAFFHLFPVTVAGTAMIMDIRTAKVDNGWVKDTENGIIIVPEGCRQEIEL